DQRVQQRADTRHDAIAPAANRSRASVFAGGDFGGEVPHIDVRETREVRGVSGNAVRRRGIRQDPRVGASGHRNVVERVGDREELLVRRRHRPPAGAAGEYKGTVDVEQNQGGNVQRSAFAANVAGAGPLGWRLLIEADALTFLELVEANLARTSMK